MWEIISLKPLKEKFRAILTPGRQSFEAATVHMHKLLQSLQLTDNKLKKAEWVS